MWNARLDETQAGIKIGRHSNNLRYADDTMLMTESEEELKMKQENEKAGLKQHSKSQVHGIIPSLHGK